MLKLSDYFQPLNLTNFALFVIMFVFFDILGNFVRYTLLRLKQDDRFRILDWLIGLGIFIFIWFLLSLFITPGRTEITISMGVLLIVSLPKYIKTNSYRTFFKCIWDCKVPILLTAPFLPAVFVKASTPPYYFDEMAYHYIAPFALKSLSPFKYVGGLYGDTPRLLDLFWQLVFTLTHTYSISRLFHFGILVTALCFAYMVIKRNFGLLPAFLFVFIFLSLPQDIVLTSTLGYVDIGALSFLLIGMVSTLAFLITRSSDFLVIGLAFWAMNLGTKYTGISSFVSFVFVFLIFLIFKRKEYIALFTKKLLLSLLIVFIVFGGYWYLKNIALFGNPIFPFLLPCWGVHVEPCPATSNFFGDWTLDINLENIKIILSQLLLKNRLLQFLAVAAPIFAIIGAKRKYGLVILLTSLTVYTELLILKMFSGFYIRYQQHIQLYLLLAVVMVFANKYKNKVINWIVKILLLSLLVISMFSYMFTVKNTNSLKFLNWNEINYSVGRMNIYQWVDYYFPRMKDAIKWCENPPSNSDSALARFDPDLIWFDFDGMMRVFMTNCYYANPDISIELNGLLSSAIEKKSRFWIASPNRCIPQDKVTAKYSYERPDMVELRRVNNLIICNAEEVKPNLYYFDYQKLK